MTAHKHLKQRIRARMEKTGESYAAARRQIIRSVEHDQASAARAHVLGNIPATSALRTMLAHAGLLAPHTRAPFSEAMLFGIVGGIGIGVFSFYSSIKPDRMCDSVILHHGPLIWCTIAVIAIQQWSFL